MLYSQKPLNFKANLEVVSCLIEYENKVLFFVETGSQDLSKSTMTTSWENEKLRDFTRNNYQRNF
jgi:hypothetical protein